MKINDTCHEQEIRPTKVQYSNIYLSKVTAGERRPDHRQGHKEFRGEEIKGGGLTMDRPWEQRKSFQAYLLKVNKQLDVGNAAADSLPLAVVHGGGPNNDPKKNKGDSYEGEKERTWGADR
jgi:hypothetical protein